MKLLFFIFLLMFQTGVGKFNRIARENELKENAKEAYESGDYPTASGIYRVLIDSFAVKSDAVRLNYAHSLHKIGKDQEADANYRELVANGKDKIIQSLAYQQLGVLATKNNNLQDAVTYFKQSLKANTENDGARYNYELAKKRLEQQQDQQEQEQNEQVKPSEWAKELKKKAEQLVNQNRFEEAFGLMQEGLKQDQTVKAFDNFTNRIGTIVEIERGAR